MQIGKPMQQLGMMKAARGVLEGRLASSGAGPGDRLPPERDLSERPRISRGGLRKPLTALEAEDIVERHVGRRTFLRTPSDADRSNKSIVVRLAEIISPHAAKMARLSLEPELAGHAAVHAAPLRLTEARRLANDMRTAANWAECDQLGLRPHELIAVASGNRLLADLHRLMNAVRVSVVQSRREIPQDGPSPDCRSFAEHEETIAALGRRDRCAAHAAMRKHLESVHATLLKDD